MKALLLGDVCPNVNSHELYENCDIQTLFTDTLPIFEGNDINFVNIECAFTESENAIKKFGPPLKAPIKTAEVLKKVGVNYCGLSNNHIFDYGIAGVKDTMKALDDAGITYTGFGDNYEDSRKNLIIEKDGEKVCIIAVCEHEYSYALEDRMGSRPFDEFDTMKDIREAKKENDRVIVLYHGGKERCHYPSPRLIRVCRAMADNGADVVLCQHTHCIGCYEQFENCHILYGQGNFHFTKRADLNYPASWNESLMVTYDTKSHEINFIPQLADEVSIKIAKGEEKKRILAEFEKRNNELANGEWKKGWHKFCESEKHIYLSAIGAACNENSTQRDNDVFGHYLDCEAHTDVWRELFPSYNLTNEK